MFAMHVEACRGILPDAPPTYGRAAASAIVYADRDIPRIPFLSWPGWVERPADCGKLDFGAKSAVHCVRLRGDRRLAESSRTTCPGNTRTTRARDRHDDRHAIMSVNARAAVLVDKLRSACAGTQSWCELRRASGKR